VGPLEVLVIECPGDRFKGETLLVLTSAVDSGALRIIDVTFIHKDAKGRLTSYELAELEDHELVPTMSSMRLGGCCHSEISHRSANGFHPIHRPY
jgi:hypothetical protein